MSVICPFFVIYGAYSLFHTHTPLLLFCCFYIRLFLIPCVLCYISLYPFQYEDLLREHTSFKIQLERCELELDLKERSLTDLRTALREAEERSRKIAQFVERQTEQIQHLEMTAKQAEQVSLFTVLCCCKKTVLRIRIRIHMFLGLLDPNPLVRGMDLDPAPNPSITKQKK
jgi:hypothetical protein